MRKQTHNGLEQSQKSRHTPFNFRTPEELLKKAAELGVDLPFEEAIAPLFEPYRLRDRSIPNRMVVQPMEGCDSSPEGSPTDLTFRRYERYARGASGSIWFEAASVMRNGRSSPKQLWLQEDNSGEFRKLVDTVRRVAHSAYGEEHNPLLVLQVTHSGRYSKPEGVPLDKIPRRNPYLDKESSAQLYTDEELDDIKDKFIEAVKLASSAGFDAVDIKACHGYLIGELLGNRISEESKYGGSWENRSNFLLDIVKSAKAAAPDMLIAVRLNVTDGIPFPYGFGTAENGSLKIDLTEPKSLVSKLIEEGCSLINISAGIPAYNPFISRPFNKTSAGKPLPSEHPLEGVARLIGLCGEMQRSFPEFPFVASGFSYLRQYWPNVASSMLKNKTAAFIGLGRSSFAYPDAPRDLLIKGKLDSKKVCIACSKCSDLLRNGVPTGCVVRDSKVYCETPKINR